METSSCTYITHKMHNQQSYQAATASNVHAGQYQNEWRTKTDTNESDDAGMIQSRHDPRLTKKFLQRESIRNFPHIKTKVYKMHLQVRQMRSFLDEGF